MPRVLTALQADADRFDADLYRLIDRATAYAESAKHGQTTAIIWRNISIALSKARPDVRAMMHPDTLDETVG